MTTFQYKTYLHIAAAQLGGCFLSAPAFFLIFFAFLSKIYLDFSHFLVIFVLLVGEMFPFETD